MTYEETETYKCSVLEREGQGESDLMAYFSYLMGGYTEGRVRVFWWTANGLTPRDTRYSREYSN